MTTSSPGNIFLRREDINLSSQPLQIPYTLADAAKNVRENLVRNHQKSSLFISISHKVKIELVAAFKKRPTVLRPRYRVVAHFKGKKT